MYIFQALTDLQELAPNTSCKNCNFLDNYYNHCCTCFPSFSSTSSSWPSTVFKLLYHLMKPLAHRLLSASMSEERGATVPTLMSEFVSVCGSEPIDTVIKGCLSPSVPTNQSELEKYKDVVTDTEKIQVCVILMIVIIVKLLNSK